MSIIVFDLEANGFLREATKIHCVCWKDLNSKYINYEVGGIDDFIQSVANCSHIVGHNIVGYDIPLIKKLYGIDLFDLNKVYDTLIWSKLFYPNLQSPTGWKGKPKPHSIEAWAMRLGGVQKQEHEDWSVFSQEMLERCKKDVLINCKLFEKLYKTYQENF